MELVLEVTEQSWDTQAVPSVVACVLPVPGGQDVQKLVVNPEVPVKAEQSAIAHTVTELPAPQAVPIGAAPHTAAVQALVPSQLTSAP